MKLQDFIVQLMADPEKKRYVYLSKTKKNMDGLGIHVSENVDMATTKVSVFVVHPIGIAQIKGEIDGVFADENSTTSEHINHFLTIKDNTFITWVDPITQELIIHVENSSSAV